MLLLLLYGIVVNVVLLSVVLLLYGVVVHVVLLSLVLLSCGIVVHVVLLTVLADVLTVGLFVPGVTVGTWVL